MDDGQEVIDLATNQCILCRLPLHFDRVGTASESIVGGMRSVSSNASILTTSVIGSTCYLGRTEPFNLERNKYQRQSALVYWKGSDSAEKVLVRQYPWELCSHRGHRMLGLCYHQLCHSLLQRLDTSLTSRTIWVWGWSLLWLSVPDSQRLKSFMVSRVFAACCRGLEFTTEQQTTTSGVYRLLDKMPNELKILIVSQSWRSSFFIPPMVMYEYQIRVRNQRYVSQPEKCFKASLLPPAKLYMDKIVLEDREYVALLSNKADPSLLVERPAKVFQILLVSDDRGLRRIEFHDRYTDDRFCEASHDTLWYRVVTPSRGNTISEVRGVVDVSVP